MANFCTNCGATVGGPFCTACGAAAPVQQQAAYQPGPGPMNTPVARAPGGGSAAKIILIVVGAVVLMGAIGVAGLVYVGYRAKQKIAELKNEYGIDGASSSGAAASGGTAGRAANFPPSKGAGCQYLQGQEAARILGIAVERVEFNPSGADGAAECKYWVTAAERRKLLGSEIASGFGKLGKENEKDQTAAFENLLGGALGAVIEANGENKSDEAAFVLSVSRTGGRVTWEKLAFIKSESKDIPVEGNLVNLLGQAVAPVEGIGDKAALLPAGHSMIVLKGDAFFALGFKQFVPGREKTTELAKIVVGRL